MGWRCTLGCETLSNYSRACPDVMDSMEPDAFQMIEGGELQCLELCRSYGYEYTAMWIHFTNFESYFSCFRAYRSGCDFWEIYRHCSPLEEIPIFCMQLLSLICSILMLICLRREIKKGLLQQAWFMINVHIVFQGLCSEQGYLIWTIYGQGSARTMGALIIRYAHMWVGVFGALGWFTVAGLSLLRLTQSDTQRLPCKCLSSAAGYRLFLVSFELFLWAMVGVSTVAHVQSWWISFYSVWTLVVLGFITGGFVCYTVPVCRTWRLQRLAEKQTPIQHGRNKIRLGPFLLLLTVVLVTYLPSVFFFLLPPISKSVVTFTFAVGCVELVGVWNLLAFTMACSGKNQFGEKVVRVWFRNGRLVCRGNQTVQGIHSFVRHIKLQTWWISHEETCFGSSCTSEAKEPDSVVGEVEQIDGVLTRWIKSPPRGLLKTGTPLSQIGLPLGKYHIYVDDALHPLFPPNLLVKLPTGYCLPGLFTDKVEEQKPQMLAAEDYEEAANVWRTLHGERLEKNDDATIFERAQIDWAHEEALLKVQESITALLRWRLHTCPASPTTENGELLSESLFKHDLVEPSDNGDSSHLQAPRGSLVPHPLVSAPSVGEEHIDAADTESLLSLGDSSARSEWN